MLCCARVQRLVSKRRQGREAASRAGVIASRGRWLGVGVLACAAPLASAQTATWVGSAPNGSGNWGVAANWSPAVVPSGPTFDVFSQVAPLGVPYTITLNAPFSIRDFTLTSSQGTLALTGNRLTTSRAFLLDEATITAAGGGVTNNGGTELRGGSVLMGVDLRANSGVTILTDDDPVDICDTDIGHRGTGSWSGLQDLQFNMGSTLTVESGSTLSIGSTGNATWDGLAGQPLITNNGTITKVANAGTTTFSGPSINNLGSLIVETNSTARLVTPATLSNFVAGTLINGSFELRGVLQFDGASITTLKSDVTLDGAGAVIRNQLNQDAIRPLALVDTGSTLTIRNKTVTVNPPLVLRGTLDLEAGTLVENTSPFTIESTGQLVGTGTVQAATILVSGGISPGESPGVLQFTNNVQFRAGSRLRIEIAGPVAGQQYDVLFVQNTLGFQQGSTAGRVDVLILPPFEPQIGQVFDIVRFADRVGQFAQFTGLNFSPDREFVVEYLPDRVRLIVVGSSCQRVDLNNDGQIDFFDFLEFSQAFAGNLPPADFNNDGQVDFFDYLDFISEFNRCS
ncbi:MAG: hypothetical protein SFZ23_14220 [Planctomycetota bacterium]|nr:hypothetical protein [Planctomycetota bacterium]